MKYFFQNHLFFCGGNSERKISFVALATCNKDRTEYPPFVAGIASEVQFKATCLDNQNRRKLCKKAQVNTCAIHGVNSIIIRWKKVYPNIETNIKKQPNEILFSQLLFSDWNSMVPMCPVYCHFQVKLSNERNCIDYDYPPSLLCFQTID